MIFPIHIDHVDECYDSSYKGDSGADIGCDKGTPVVAVGDGKIIYSEPGHSKSYPGHEHHDTPNSIKILLDEPVLGYRYAFYTHLATLASVIHRGQSINVSKGQLIGTTGLGRGVPHLHLSIYEKDGSNSRYIYPKPLAHHLWNVVLREQLMSPQPPLEDELKYHENATVKNHHIDIPSGVITSYDLGEVASFPETVVGGGFKSFDSVNVHAYNSEGNHWFVVFNKKNKVIWTAPINEWDIAGVINASYDGVTLIITYAYL